MNKKFFAVLFGLSVCFMPLFAKDFTGFFDVSFGDNFNLVEQKLLSFGWQKEEMFQNINEYKNESAQLYGYRIQSMDLKFNHDKLAMFTVYFDLDLTTEEDPFSAIKDKIVSDYDFSFQNEAGSFNDGNYKGTFLSNRKMLIVSCPKVSGVNFMVSISDIDLLLNTTQPANEDKKNDLNEVQPAGESLSAVVDEAK